MSLKVNPRQAFSKGLPLTVHGIKVSLRFDSRFTCVRNSKMRPFQVSGELSNGKQSTLDLSEMGQFQSIEKLSSPISIKSTLNGP